MTDNRGAHPDLSSLIASRICHDLISPLGAIGNGVELLGLDGQIPSAELSLITESVTNASARIRFFRLAFGAAQAEQQAMAAELAPVLADLSKGGRIAYSWTTTGPVARIEAKLAFLSILCLETAMPYGGAIAASRQGHDWQITASGRNLRFDPVLWDPLRRAGALLDAPLPGDLRPAHVQFAILPAELQRDNRRLALDLRDTGAALRF
jgi:histidine phosphotransferase ChpT